MDRKELIKLGAAAVRKNFKGAISEVASKALEFPSVWASTGSLSFDRLCAGRNPGGIPMGPSMGRIIHIYGEWACGKSLILDELFRSVIVDLKGIAKCTETEGSRDPHFAQAIGLPLDLLSVDRPDTFEQAFDMFETWHEEIRKQDDEIPILWGFDSLDSTEADKSARQGLSESGGWHFGGGRAEVLGAGLRRMARICSRYPTTMVMLNQTRDNVGVLFGDKKRTPGGSPPHFYASLEVSLKGSSRPDKGFVRAQSKMPDLTKEAIKRLGLYDADKGSVLGRYITAKVTKTKIGPTFDTTAEFYIDFRNGVHRWEGFAERLMFEGILKTGRDANTDYEMNGQKFATKQEWLNWLAAELRNGNWEVVNGALPEAKP